MNYTIDTNELDVLFDTFEEETKFDNTFLQIKQGEKAILFMLPPIELEGKKTLQVEVEGEYNGKATKQWIGRFINAPLIDKKPSFDNAKLVGVLLNRTMCNELIGFHRQGFQLTSTSENPNMAIPLLLKHDGKRSFTPAPNPVKMPDAILERAVTELSWETLLQSYKEMQEAFDKKKTKVEPETPW